MFRLLPWSSAIGGNKVMTEELKMLASPHCASPGVNSLVLPQLKRKRSDSGDSIIVQDAPVATKLRSDDTPDKSTSIKHDPSPTINDASAVSQGPTSPRRPQDSTVTDQNAISRKVDVEKLRETLEAQLSLEVLLKHNELRLIDQEIAKCQIALEQLRRCAEIPYPGSHLTGVSQAVSNGTGMVVFAPGNGPAPLSPAPWGVTDGPYTRHYARWLIPDPRFDGGEFDPGTPLASSVAGTPLVEGRSTRGNPGDGGYLASKSRPQRGSAGARLQSLPSGYPPPKEKAGPMIIRRKSDGVLVKLICLDCRRDNFSSTQGFINHCRIAHNRNFASHDAAAMASGEPVEVDEAGAVVRDKNEPPSTATAGFVHPLIRSAHVIESSKTPSSASDSAGDAVTPRKRSASSWRASSAVETPAGALLGKRATPAGMKAPNVSFMASPDTPHLSSLMQLKGVGLDLDRLVEEAKTTVDLGEYSSGEESDDESVPASADTTKGQTLLGGHVGRQPMRTTVGQTASQRPNSRKGLDKMGLKPLPLESLTPTRSGSYQSPYGPMSSLPQSSQMVGLREEDGIDGSANLSPNTIELNQAPSLVSDDDDYGAASDSDSPGLSSSEAEDHEEDFSHIDVEDDEDTTTSTATTDPKPDPGMASAAHSPAPLPKSLRRGNTKKKDRLISNSIVPVQRAKEEKHVSFVSPNSSPAKGKKNNNNRKSNGTRKPL